MQEMEDKVKNFLGMMNKRLRENNPEVAEELFLVGGQYTLADVYLTSFLTRVKVLNLKEEIWNYEALKDYHK